MTKNLAGRGEGLAGLEIVNYADGTNGSYCIARTHGEKWMEYWNPNGWKAFGYVFKDKQLAEALIAALEAAAPAGTAAQQCDKQTHMYVWTVSPRWVAVAQAKTVAEAREALLEEIGSSGDGSCPEREAANKFVREHSPNIWHARNAEFALTDSAELREQEAYVETLQKKIAALATLSLQAPPIESFVGNMPVITVTDGAPPNASPPSWQEQSKVFSTTSAREQSAATASSNLSAGDEVWIKSRVIAKHEVRGVLIRVDGVGEPIMLQTWVPAEHFDKLRAVTQEQPAGSGASELYAYVCPANCGCMWRDNQDGTMSLFGPRSQPCEVCEPLPLEKLIPVHVHRWTAEQIEEGKRRGKETYAAIVGSPRKVGEDGAEQLMTATGPVSLADFSRNLADGIYAISDGAAPDRETLRAMIRARLEVGLKYWKWERLAARSSSVPVGEQKQEEGV